MKLSSSVLLLSLVVGSGAASSVTAATQLRRSTSAQTTPRGRRLKEPVGQCGACKKDDECAGAGSVCVSATASGCFNFETDDKDSYCAPGPPTPSPVAATEAPAAADAAAANATSVPVPAGTTAPTDASSAAAADRCRDAAGRRTGMGPITASSRGSGRMLSAAPRRRRQRLRRDKGGRVRSRQLLWVLPRRSFFVGPNDLI